MTEGITISAGQRDVPYDRILVHLADINQVWLAVRAEDFGEVDRLGRLTCNELRLVLDDLGWGESQGKDRIRLTTPPDAVCRVMQCLHGQASACDRSLEFGTPTMRRAAEQEDREVVEVCEEVLVALGGAPVASGRSPNV